MNPRPKAYESSALPLSYSGSRRNISRTNGLVSNPNGKALGKIFSAKQQKKISIQPTALLQLVMSGDTTFPQCGPPTATILVFVAGLLFL